jgi:hypothetical protein
MSFFPHFLTYRTAWACTAYHWDTETCEDAIVAGIVLGDMLLPLFAYIIYLACGLQNSCTGAFTLVAKLIKRPY